MTNEPKEPKQVIQFSRTAYTSEDFETLQRQAKDAGARIIRTTALSNGSGIHVIIESDADKRQF